MATSKSYAPVSLVGVAVNATTGAAVLDFNLGEGDRVHLFLDGLQAQSLLDEMKQKVAPLKEVAALYAVATAALAGKA